MSRTHVTPQRKVQRNIFTFSCESEARRNTLLKDSFMEIARALGHRPFPTSIWNETATGDRLPWKAIVNALRSAVYASVRSGDQSTIKETTDAAIAFLDEIKADFLTLVPPTSEAGIVALALQEAECAGPARFKEMALVASPTPIEAERAIAPLLKEESALVRLIGKCQRVAREPLTATRMAR